jgi:3',5'-cyclic AMP phosphodiesterase CpdA
MRLLVCSDIHFFAPSLNPSQIFSKEIIGNLNALFLRMYNHPKSYIECFLNQLSSLNVSHLLILGDLTTTSSKKEFALAQQFISEIQNKKITVFAIPGNHDQYTIKAYREKRFYHMLENFLDFKGDSPLGFSFSENKVAAYMLDNEWCLVTLDTTLKTPLNHASGLFSTKIEESFNRILSSIPKGTKIIVANHFPVETELPDRKSLYRRNELYQLLKRHPQVEFYLHGHHHTCLFSKKDSFQIVDPGSLTRRGDANFIVIDKSKESLKIEVYRKKDSLGYELV